MKDQLLTITDVCTMLNRHRSTIRRWVIDKTLPRPVRINGVIIGWRKEDIKNWLDDNLAKNTERL